MRLEPHPLQQLIVVGALVIATLSGCASVTLQCPTNGQMEATLNNPSVVDIASGLMAILAAGGVMGSKPLVKTAAPNPPTYAGTMTWKTLALLGTQSASCGSTPATQITKQ